MIDLLSQVVGVVVVEVEEVEGRSGSSRSSNGRSRVVALTVTRKGSKVEEEELIDFLKVVAIRTVVFKSS